jgi:hypothetical protein
MPLNILNYEQRFDREARLEVRLILNAGMPGEFPSISCFLALSGWRVVYGLTGSYPLDAGISLRR